MSIKTDLKELEHADKAIDNLFNRIGINDLYEMTNLFPQTTKLPYTIWISTKGKAKHSPRVKIDAEQEVVISIEDEPRIIHGELKAKDFELIKKWIIFNKEILMRHWSGEIDGVEVGREILLHRIEDTPIINSEDLLIEMANAYQKDTGINGTLMYSTKGEMTNLQAHSLGRVKLSKDGENVFVSIKKTDKGERIIGGTNK